MKTIAQATGALFAVAMAVAPVWADLTLTDVGLPVTAVGLPDDSGWTSTAWTAGNKTLEADTAFTGIGTTNGQTSTITSDITATNYNLSLEGSGVGTQIAWNGTITAKTIYLKQGRFSPANRESLGFLGSATVYVKGQFFANANASGATTTGISLLNDFYFAPSSYTESNFDYVSIRVHDGNLSLTGKVTLLPESTSSKGTVKVKTGNDASANRTLTLSQLDLTQVAVGGNTTECLTVLGDLTVVFADGATLNLPDSVVDQGWVKVLTAGKANAASFEALTVQLVQLNGDPVDSQQYTVVKNAAMGSIKVMTARDPRVFKRTLSTANEQQWTAGAEETLWGDAGVNPSEIDSVALTVATPSTLTLSEETMVTSLTLNGPSALTFKPTTSEEPTTGSLTVLSSTVVNTDIDVSAITASLGAVTLASGKTLTMNGLAFSEMTNNGGALCFKGGTANSTLLQTFDGTMTLRDGADVTLPGQYTMTSAQRFIADSGNATLKLYNNRNATDGVVDLEGDETIQVKAGATLTLKARDLGGWDGYSGANLVVAVRGERAKITASNYDTNHGCFAGRVVLADGGEIAGGSTGTASLNFFGTTSTNADYPEIYVPSGTGTWSGYLWRNKDIVVKVDKDATFVLSGTLKNSKDANNKALTKVGAGEMKITANQTENSGAYIINEGQLTFATETELTLSNTISGAGTVKKSGAGTLSLTGTMSGFTGAYVIEAGKLILSTDGTLALPNTISGSGTIKKSGAGTLSLTGTVSTPVKVELAAGTLDLGTNRPTLGAVAEDATLKLTVTTAEAAAGAVVVPTTLETAPDKARFSVVNGSGDPQTVNSVTVANGLLTLALPVSEPTFTVTNDSDGTWAECPPSGNVTIAANQLTKDKTVTIPAPAEGTRDLTRVTVVGNTMAKVTLVVESGVTIATLVPYGYVRVDVDTVNALTNAPVVSEGATLEVVADAPVVSEGATLEVVADSSAMLNKAISGAGKFAKGGTGTLTLNQNITTTGGTIVQEGTLKFSSNGYVNASNYDNATGDVTVGADATLDLNGKKDLMLRTITLAEGATYRNGGAAVEAGNRQLRAIKLTGNATVDAAANFGLVAGGWGETTLNLGGYTLTKEGRGQFWISNCTVSNGTLKVTEGSFSGNDISDNARPITISGNVKLERAEGAPAAACFDFSQANSSTKPLTIASGATLTMAGPAVTDGIKLGHTVLMGNLVVNSDVSPTIASHPITSLSVAADSTVAAALLNCVRGSTTVESDKTLTLSGTGVSLTKLPTGTGSVKIPAESSVTYANGDNAYSGKTTVEGTLTLACELGFTEATGANPTYPIKIAQGGTVELANGGATHRSFQGEGDIEVTGNATLGIPTKASVAGGFSLKGTITVNAGVTLTVAAWEEDVQALSGANLCVKGTIAKSNSNYSEVPTVKIAANKTLSGTGTISVPVELKGTLETSAALTFEKRVTVAAAATLNGTATFASGAELWAEYPAQFSGAVTFVAGAVLDVTQYHTPVFAGQLTLPETPLALRADGLFANALITTRGSLDAADFTFAEDSTVTSATHGIYVKVGDATVQYLMVVKKPSIPAIAGDDEAKSEASALQEVLIAEFLERTGGLYPLSGVTATGNAKVEGALLFDNVRTLVKYVNENNVPDHYEYEVAYDFGVADMTIKSLQLLPGDNATTMYVLLAAKVQNSADSNTASFAEGTKLTVLNGTKEITPTPVSAAEAGAVAETGVQWLAVPLARLFSEGNSLGTRSLKVKASKASN